MKRKNTPASRRTELTDLLRRIQGYRSARGEFSYAERGRAVTEALCLFQEASELARRFPVDMALSEASAAAEQLWTAAMKAAYPPGFWEDVRNLKAGDAAGLESAICFLEADPYFLGTGYNKVSLTRYIKPHMLTPSDKARLQTVVLSRVERRQGSDLSAFIRLAKKVDDASLRKHLTRRMESSDPDVKRRARWVLEALALKDYMEQGKLAAQQKKKQHHVRGHQTEEAE